MITPFAIKNAIFETIQVSEAELKERKNGKGKLARLILVQLTYTHIDKNKSSIGRQLGYTPQGITNHLERIEDMMFKDKSLKNLIDKINSKL
jgi:predicted transcriptional regulator